MAWSSTDLTNLEDAIAQGVTTLVINGKTVTYRSLADMLALRDVMRREIGLSTAQNAKRVTRTRYKRQ
jgi:hypothetical protein